jgi:hypothetical protein
VVDNKARPRVLRLTFADAGDALEDVVEDLRALCRTIDADFEEELFGPERAQGVDECGL